MAKLLFKGPFRLKDQILLISKEGKMSFREILEVGSRESLTFKKKNAVRLVRQSPPYKDICFYIPRFLPFALGHLFSSSPEGGPYCRATGEGGGILRVHGSPIGG